jgi:hypothetical protein
MSIESSSRESNKMKFLDNLFDTHSERVTNHKEHKEHRNSIDHREQEEDFNPIERSYIRLEDETNFSSCKNTKNSKNTYLNNTNKNLLLNKMSSIFGLKIWMGTVLSFFLLCYVFSFRLIVVIPLLFLALIIYTVMSLGHSYYMHYVKQIRHFVRVKFLGKEKCEDGFEYRLMEI